MKHTIRFPAFAGILTISLLLTACPKEGKGDDTAMLALAAVAISQQLPAGFIGACVIPSANQGATKNYCNETFFSTDNSAKNACELGGNTFSTTTRCSTNGLLATCKSKYAAGHYNLGYYATSITQGDCNGAGGTTNVLASTVQTVP